MKTLEADLATQNVVLEIDNTPACTPTKKIVQKIVHVMRTRENAFAAQVALLTQKLIHLQDELADQKSSACIFESAAKKAADRLSSVEAANKEMSAANKEMSFVMEEYSGKPDLDFENTLNDCCDKK